MATTELITTAGDLLYLGPAVIAVGGIMVNNWLGTRSQRDRANQQALREAAGALLSSVDLVLVHTHELIQLLESDANGLDQDQHLAEEHRGYVEAWRQMRTRLAVVRVSGPVSVAKAARDLVHAASL
jgi:hypothetical protein